LGFKRHRDFYEGVYDQHYNYGRTLILENGLHARHVHMQALDNVSSKKLITQYNVGQSPCQKFQNRWGQYIKKKKKPKRPHTCGGELMWIQKL
jgi:uncharacterized protein YifE (UPF0438 family)